MDVRGFSNLKQNMYFGTTTLFILVGLKVCLCQGTKHILSYNSVIACRGEKGRDSNQCKGSGFLPAFHSHRLPRTKYTSQQVLELEREFQRNPYPSSRHRDKLSSRLDIHKDRVQVCSGVCGEIDTERNTERPTTKQKKHSRSTNTILSLG